MRTKARVARQKRFCRLAQAVVAVLFIFLLSLSNIVAFALNTDYLDERKWNTTKNATTVSLDKTSLGGQLTGTFSYYIDNYDPSIYTCFSVKESSLSEKSQIVQIKYDFKSESETYSFSVDKDGICEAGDYTSQIFTAESNFGFTDPVGKFISAVQYGGRDEAYYIDITLVVNGHYYLICENLYMKKPEKTTTQKAQKTTVKKEKTTKKAKEKTSKKERTTKVKTTKQKVTKFHASTTKFNAEIEPDDTDSLTDGNENTNELLTNEPSDKKKLVFCIGAALIALGIALVLVSSSKIGEDTNENDNEEE